MSSSQVTALLRIELVGVEPLVWRRLRVPLATSLPNLHRWLQVAFDWEDRQPHEFQVGALRFGHPDAEDAPEGLQDESDWTLHNVLATQAESFSYAYGTDESWQHGLVLEPAERTSAGAGFAPLCLAGENAAPPEELDGPAGYAEFLAALADARHPKHERYLEWIGGIFDPHAFDLNRINKALRKRRKA
jgi:hypothetical protein